jgi:hypothetical protein
MTRGELVVPPYLDAGAEGVATLPNGVRLRRGQEWWEDTPHRLAARINRERRAGRIHEVARYRLQPGRHGSIVVRLKPRPSRRRVAALWGSGAAVAASAVAAGTWWVAVHLEAILTVIFAAAVAAILLAALTRFLGGHQPTCAGLHCPGCRR